VIAQQVANGVLLGAIYLLIAIGISLCWGTLNVLNLAHGPVFMFSAFAAYLVTTRTHHDLSLWTLVGLGVVVGAVMELLLDIAVFRIIRRRTTDLRQAESSMLLASIGASAVLVAIANAPTLGAPFSVSSKPLPTGVQHIGGVSISNLEIIVVAVALITVAGLAVWVARTRNGRALRAIAFDAETSGLMGINQNRLSAVTLLFSGATAGAAGIFLAVVESSLSAGSGQDLLLKAFAAVVLGGVGSIWGTALGAFVLAGGETVVTATTSGSWTDAVSFGIIILVLLVRPNGVFGRVRVDRA
jgi:branched-chain amino acid transport system permease protein